MSKYSQCETTGVLIRSLPKGVLSSGETVYYIKFQALRQDLTSLMLWYIALSVQVCSWKIQVLVQGACNLFFNSSVPCTTLSPLSSTYIVDLCGYY